MPKLSVIIVNYNVQHFLEACLHSLEKAIAGIDTEIFIVDNASVDGSASFLMQLSSEISGAPVKIIQNSKNLGFARANNQAISESNSDFILLLNPDTLVSENALSLCIERMEKDDLVGAIGVNMIDGSGGFLRESKRGFPSPGVAFYKLFGLSKLFPKSKKFGAYHLGYLPENVEAEVDVLAGCFMFLRKSALDRCGALDEDFFMYGEDIDLSYRIQKAGYKNLYLPSARIIHFKGESTHKESSRYVRVFYKAMSIFARKHATKGSASLFSFLINIAIILRGLGDLIIKLLGKVSGPFLDALLIYAGLFVLKNFWEEYIKAAEFLTYPPEFMTINAPLYTFIWVFMSYLFGGYHQPFRKRSVFIGIFWGTLIISAIYGFLSESLRFSRSLIIAGAAWSLVIMLLSRFIRRRNSKKLDSLSEETMGKTVFVGEAEEFAKLRGMLQARLNINREPYKYLLEDGTPASESSFVEVSQILKPHTFILGASLGIERSISLMKDLASRKIRFLFYWASPGLLIGSHSVDTRGEALGTTKNLLINNTRISRIRKLSTSAVSLLLLVLHPLIFWRYKSTQIRISGFIKCFLGKSAYIGSKDDLRTMSSLFHLEDELEKRNFPEELIKSTGREYTRDYSFIKELRYFFRFAFDDSANAG